MKELRFLTILLILTVTPLVSQPKAYWHTVHLENWFIGTVPPDSIPFRQITNLILFDGHTFGKSTSPSVPGYFQPPSNITGTYWARVAQLAHQNGVKMELDLGTNVNSEYADVCQAGPGAMQTWAGSVARAIVLFNYDGADFDAEGGRFPINGGMGTMAQLLHDSLAALNPGKKYDITVSCMPNYSDVVGYGISANGAQYFDQVNPMWYDQCNPLADPLFKSSTHGCWGSDSSVGATYEHAGIPKSKIGLGYAVQVYDGCSSCITYFNQVIRYFPGSTIYRDDEAKATWYVGNGHTILYEDEWTTWWKADFIKRKGYGGAMGFCMGRGYLPTPPAGWDRNPAITGMGRGLFGSGPPPIDSVAPLVSLTAPLEGDTVTGIVSLAATASDNVGVARVEFIINGSVAFTDMAPPYSASWNTDKLAGAQSIAAKAYDFSGNSATSPQVTAYVKSFLPKISGRMFLDVNSDGASEPGEPGLSLWRINLDRTSPDRASYSMLTDAKGQFSFESLPRGTYQLSESSMPSSGDSVLQWTRTHPSNSLPYSVVIDADTTSVVRDFGNFSPGMRVMSAFKNWNLLSLPYSVTDNRATTVFPFASSYAWQYTDRFISSANVTTGPGYWVRFSAPATWALAGGQIDQATIPVTDGWNLIGSIAEAVSTDALLGANPYLVSKFFGYRGGGGFMAEDTVEPGKGYWVKASGAGQILLSKAEPQHPRLTDSSLDLRQLNSITFTSNSGDAQSLFFAANSSLSNRTSSYAMPPPMDGMFDARFSAGSSPSSGALVNIVDLDHVQSIDLPIVLRTADYPLTVRWEVRDLNAQAELLVGGGRSILLEGNGQGPIQSDPAGPDPAAGRRVTLRLNSTSKSTLPAAFELFQNFPNPFNPATSIRFSLADDSFVQLDVMNLLGQKVSAVLRRQMGAGSHSISFDASRLPSGVYFYRLHARGSSGKEFTQVKRMVLLR